MGLEGLFSKQPLPRRPVPTLDQDEEPQHPAFARVRDQFG